MKSILLFFMGMVFISGCSFAPKYNRPQIEVPEQWSSEHHRGTPAAVQWWKRFDDPTLDSLIQEVLENNKDLKASIARIDYARAQLGIARAEIFPLVSGSVQATPTWVDNKKFYEGIPPYGASFSASWEIDLWGKLRNAKSAAFSQLMASEFGREGFMLSLTAQTATTYFLLRSLDLQVAIAERTVKSREDALVIYTARYNRGLISKLDLARARTEVEVARTTLYQTRIMQGTAETALFVLLGRSPREIMGETIQHRQDVPVYEVLAPPVIPQGLPSELLERRPDIRQAEYMLRAANANIGVAKAAWFPSISLTGLFGLVSPQLHELLKNPLTMWGYGVTGSMPVLDFGRVYYNVDAAEAKERELLCMYEKTVENAFKDIRDALLRQKESSNIVDSLKRTVEEITEAVMLVRMRYDNGYSSYLEVLDAERTLFQSELNLAAAWSDRLAAIVSVCLALGGSWELPLPVEEH